jgi:hypothetical protein
MCLGLCPGLTPFQSASNKSFPFVAKSTQTFTRLLSAPARGRLQVWNVQPRLVTTISLAGLPHWLTPESSSQAAY